MIYDNILCVGPDGLLSGEDVQYPKYYEGLVMGLFIGLIIGVGELTRRFDNFLRKNEREMDKLNRSIQNIENSVDNIVLAQAASKTSSDTVIATSRYHPNKCEDQIVEDDDEPLYPSNPPDSSEKTRSVNTTNVALANMFDTEEKKNKVHHLPRKQENDILNTFDSIKGKKYSIASEVVKKHNYTLHPIYINDVKNKNALPSFNERVIGVFVRDPAYSLNNTLTNDAVIESLIDVGGIDSRNVGRFL